MKSQYIELVELLVELRDVINTETEAGNIGPQALDITERVLDLHKKPIGFNICSAKMKLGVLYHARNLIDNATKEED